MGASRRRCRLWLVAPPMAIPVPRRRVDLASREDTILLRPSDGGLVCPGSSCVPSMKRYVDTVAVPAQRPGPLWVRVDLASRRLVDSTIVLPANRSAS
jgi:hypothetical protein